MRTTKTQLAVRHAMAGCTIRYALDRVLLETGGKATATNGKMLAQVTDDAGQADADFGQEKKDELLDAAGVKLILATMKATKVEAIDTDSFNGSLDREPCGKFPDYQKIVDDAKRDTSGAFWLNLEMLEKTCKIFREYAKACGKKKKDDVYVRLDLFEERRQMLCNPMVMTYRAPEQGTATVILMPVDLT
jgi:hypothetical protein